MTATSTSTPDAAATSAKPVIACQALTKTFKDFWLRSRAKAVDSVTFEIREHEIFGLLGPNGSGKSTTIKMILGLLRPTAGRLVVFGKSPSDVRVKKRIGYLPEESYLYPFLNARETLDYYGKLFELDSRTRKRRVDELLDMVGLASAQFRPVREYSKGMQRRIGLAQALINDPDLLILDEPTTGLDPLGTRQVKDLIIELGRRGKTVLLSSHLLADVEDCVDRMVILYGGKIRAEGDQHQLLDKAGRTTIETDTLDDETVAQIDRMIRERSGGNNEIRSVTQPRQKLEELFLNIVQTAQAEQLSTSGATHAGETASFLKGEEESGEDLISSLVSAGEDVRPMQEEERQVPAEATEDAPGEDVIGSLLGDEPKGTPAAEAEPAKHPAPDQPRKPDAANASKPAADVDAGVIDSLLGGADDDEPESKA